MYAEARLVCASLDGERSMLFSQAVMAGWVFSASQQTPNAADSELQPLQQIEVEASLCPSVQCPEAAVWGEGEGKGEGGEAH